ncbi:30S ribosomal protein S8 [Candidatus Margulisiibacteriota bacterium]
MFITDPIADMFTRIRNALIVKKETVLVPFSKIKVDILKLIKKEGYINGYEILDINLENAKTPKKFIKVVLKYDKDGKSVISKMLSKSKPSSRVYVRKKEIAKVLNGYGFNILSTSKGLLTGKEARINNTGGELLVEIY